MTFHPGALLVMAAERPARGPFSGLGVARQTRRKRAASA